ncbi:uncharacterized protein LOC110447915 [Mizuhopecten yessoensis]|uniref:Profilin n=1 Tax=Mizuhopecten yessoensis TaxID=6573 RepID=A0A210QU80_MIZYE|nr:uncharacterized protein LOC110447915 [Mizuhopecten yessoensis]OWF52308.1 hypothetical protein KP79_PYT09359 [Mizuhopecten yessoensis]
MEPVPTWDQLITGQLLRHNVVSGVLLLTRHGQPAYTYGELDIDPTVKESQNFVKAFQQTQSHQTSKNDTFTIQFKNRQQVNFTVYKRSHCSIYATSYGNRDSLIICNLPHGVMLCTSHLPTQAGQVITLVEHFCDMLRA